MNESTYKKLNSTETILKAMPAIIEAFVTFYGESEREYIESKFKNILVIGYCSPKSMERILSDDKKQKSTELIDQFLTAINITSKSKEELKNIFFHNFDFELFKYHPIIDYINYLNGEKDTLNIRKIIQFLQQLYPEVNESNLDEMIQSKSLEGLDQYVAAYIEILGQYKKYEESIKPYNDYLKKCQDLKGNLEKRSAKKLVDSLKDLFTETELEEIEAIFQNKYYTYYMLKDANAKTKNFLGYRLNGTSLIEAFSQENDELLANGTQWQKDSIIKDRIQYFKNFGLNLGDNYEVYLNDLRAKELIPSKELIERIKSKKTQLYTEMMNEYYQSLPEFQHNIKRIDAEGLLDKSGGYNANTYENNSTHISTNIKKSDNGYTSFPLLCISMGTLSEYLDHYLIHELNHIFELHLQGVTDNQYHMVCGWDIVSGEISTERSGDVPLEKREEKRNYELMNEIINELIAQEIHGILIQSGQFVFNTKNDVKIKGGTSYESTIFLIKDFYERYKKEIIESRRTGDMTILFETVGKDNFDELNKLFHVFNENFSGMKFYTVITELEKGLETERTKILKEIVVKRNQILANMEEHSRKKVEIL